MNKNCLKIITIIILSNLGIATPMNGFVDPHEPKCRNLIASIKSVVCSYLSDKKEKQSQKQVACYSNHEIPQEKKREQDVYQEFFELQLWMD